MTLPNSEQLDRTAAWIASVQRGDGSIPWWPDGHCDPWDHVEAALALDARGWHEEARRAYRWLARVQRPDGAWEASYLHGRPNDATLDANFCAYIAAGVWHHHLAADRTGFLEEMWSTVEPALDFVLGLQRVDGAVDWARDARLCPWDGALLTSSSCIHLSLSCAISIAEALGCDRPDWELSLQTLGDAIRTSPDAFEDKGRYSMDLYYPVLGGAVRDEPGRRRLLEGWDRFVIEGFGVRCVADRPWVTAAETCEMVLALDAVGMREEAEVLFDWVQHLRDADGGYWTGATRPRGAIWPVEKTTWSAAAVILAADALYGEGPGSSFFRSGAFAGTAIADLPLQDPL